MEARGVGMIARWREHMRTKFVRWVQRWLIQPAVDNVLWGLREDQSLTRARVDAVLNVTSQHTVRILDELSAVRAELERVRGAFANHDQMRDFDARLTSVDERLSHLTAQMFGKTVAEKIQQSRGPREFSYEDRQ